MKKIGVIAACTVLILSLAVSFALAETVIRLATPGGGPRTVCAGVVREFNEVYKGQYRVEMWSGGMDELRDKVTMQFISESPLFDVVTAMTGWGPLWGRYLEDLNKWVSKHDMDPVSLYGAAIVEECRYEGKLFGLPWRVGTYIMFYRKDWFASAGLSVPKTLEEWETAARKLTRDKDGDGIVDVYGTSLGEGASLPDFTVQTLAGYFWPFGGRFLTEELDGVSSSLKGPGAIKAFSFMKMLTDDQLVPDPLDWTYHDLVPAFQNEILASAPAFSFRSGLIENPKDSKAAGKMGYARIPYKPYIGPHKATTCMGCWTLGINANSPVKGAAFEFIKFFISHDMQKKTAMEWANGPPVLSVLRDPDYMKAWPAAQAMMESLESGARQIFPVRETGDLIMIVHEEVQNLLLGKKSPEQAAKSMYDRIARVEL